MAGRLGLELVALGAKVVDLVEHPLEKGLGRSRGNAGSLELEDLLAVSPDLGSHAPDFRTHVVKPHGAPFQLKPYLLLSGQPRSTVPASAGREEDSIT